MCAQQEIGCTIGCRLRRFSFGCFFFFSKIRSYHLREECTGCVGVLSEEEHVRYTCLRGQKNELIRTVCWNSWLLWRT